MPRRGEADTNTSPRPAPSHSQSAPIGSRQAWGTAPRGPGVNLSEASNAAQADALGILLRSLQAQAARGTPGQNRGRGGGGVRFAVDVVPELPVQTSKAFSIPRLVPSDGSGVSTPEMQGRKLGTKLARMSGTGGGVPSLLAAQQSLGGAFSLGGSAALLGGAESLGASGFQAPPLGDFARAVTSALMSEMNEIYFPRGEAAAQPPASPAAAAPPAGEQAAQSPLSAAPAPVQQQSPPQRAQTPPPPQPAPQPSAQTQTTPLQSPRSATTSSPRLPPLAFPPPPFYQPYPPASARPSPGLDHSSSFGSGQSPLGTQHPSQHSLRPGPISDIISQRSASMDSVAYQNYHAADMAAAFSAASAYAAALAEAQRQYYAAWGLQPPPNSGSGRSGPYPSPFPLPYPPPGTPPAPWGPSPAPTNAGSSHGGSWHQLPPGYQPPPPPPLSPQVTQQQQQQPSPGPQQYQYQEYHDHYGIPPSQRSPRGPSVSPPRSAGGAGAGAGGSVGAAAAQAQTATSGGSGSTSSSFTPPAVSPTATLKKLVDAPKTRRMAVLVVDDEQARSLFERDRESNEARREGRTSLRKAVRGA